MYVLSVRWNVHTLVHSSCSNAHDTQHRRIAPATTGHFPRLDAGPQPLTLGRESVHRFSASLLLLRSGARGDSPAARITSPPLTAPLAGLRVPCHASPYGRTLWDSLDGCACRADSPCPAALCSRGVGAMPPLTSTLLAGWRGKWCRHAGDPPANSHRHPRTALVSRGLGLGTRCASVWTTSPRCTHLAVSQRLPQYRYTLPQFESCSVRRTSAKDRTTAGARHWAGGGMAMGSTSPPKIHCSVSHRYAKMHSSNTPKLLI